MTDLTAAYVAALERQNRLLRRLIAASAGLLAVAAVCGANVIPDSLIVQESFTVKDLNGINRFEMVVNKADGAANGLHVVDANGQTRIDIGVTARGEPVIYFLDAAGKPFRKLP